MTFGFTSRAVHGHPVRRDSQGALRVPIYENVAFEFASSRDIQLAFEGRRPAHAYSRITNPTVEAFEQRVRALANAHAVVATSSGMAAIAATIMALGDTGSNLVTTRFLFGNTLDLFQNTLGRWGLEVRLADMDNVDQVASSIDDNTRAVFVEAISNPQLQVADVEALVRIADTRGVPVIVDGTMTGPYIMSTRKLGVALEVISSTKAISGGATTVGGVIIDNGTFDWNLSPKLSEDAKKYGPNALVSRLRGDVTRNLGGCLSPHSAYLQTLGLETLALRMDRISDNAMAVATFLEAHPRVREVNYPGLRNSPYHAVASRQFGGRFGGLLTFDIDTRSGCFDVMDRVKLIRRATNINDNKTLIIHPASTIFTEFDEAARREMGVRDTLLRLSLGIEDPEDLISDLKTALEAR